jgi:hypothetical protein
MTQHSVTVRGQDCYCPKCGKSWDLGDEPPEECNDTHPHKTSSSGKPVQRSAQDILAARDARVASRRPAPRRQIIDFEKGCLVDTRR